MLGTPFAAELLELSERLLDVVQFLLHDLERAAPGRITCRNEQGPLLVSARMHWIKGGG